MKVVIIEDEIPAAEKLELLLNRLDNGVEVLTKIDSVKSAVQWLDDNQDSVDLLFMDIQLLDGKSFDIFQEIKITKPIIFTTAYQEYSLEAFKVNSIDYLLKPITLKSLEAAVNKYLALKEQFSDEGGNDKSIPDIQISSSYKERFMVKFGDHIRSVPVEEINYFFAEGRNVYLHTKNESKYIIDFTLEELENLLNPNHFYRVNRSFIVQLQSIKDVLVYSNSRLKITTQPESIKEIIVSRDKVGQFKTWFDGA